MGFTVQQDCPQCGAPIELDEADRLINCPYCNVSCIISPSDCFRYVMHHNAPGRQIVYAPYLRFRGAAYYCQGEDVNHRIVDISDLATSLKSLSNSLGVRSQTVKASFVTPETEGFFLPVNADPEEIVARAAKLPNVNTKTFLPQPKEHTIRREITGGIGTGLGAVIAGLGGELPLDIEYSNRNHQSFLTPTEPEHDDEEVLFYSSIGEALSIVYMPLYIENGNICDAIINEPLGRIEPEDEDALRAATTDPQLSVSFLPIMCPHCGWELEGSRNSIAFTCSNCYTAWEISGGKLVQSDWLCVPGEDSKACYLPFWKIKATCPDLGIQSHSDLMRLEKPLVPVDEFTGMEAAFIVPAFSIAPKVFLTIAQRYTFIQQVLPPVENEVEASSICAVTMPRAEAIESIKLVLASGAHNARKVSAQLPEAKIDVTDSALIYLPFNDSGYELSAQYGVPVSIIKQSLETVGDASEPKTEPEPEVVPMTCPLCGKEVPGGSRSCPYCGIGL